MMTLPSPIAYHIYTGGVPPAPNFYSYLLAGNGVFKLARTPHLAVSIPVSPGRIAGLEPWRAGVRVTLGPPKIPAYWLCAVLAHARRVGPGLEQMYHFYYSQEQGWRVAVPRQKASAGAVTYSGGDDPAIVLDLHSHHRMAAMFSATDNADEQGCRLYAVIGNIYRRPTIALRVGVYGDFARLPVWHIFEGRGPFTDTLEEL
jgi:PRTRC genetic system protein A